MFTVNDLGSNISLVSYLNVCRRIVIDDVTCHNSREFYLKNAIQHNTSLGRFGESKNRLLYYTTDRGRYPEIISTRNLNPKVHIN